MAAFIYMRNTPKGIVLFASDEVSAPGTPKRYLDRAHPQFKQVESIMYRMHSRIPTFSFHKRPTLAQLCAGIEGAVHIRGDGRTQSDRVLVK
jgi:hypothetical protein